MKNSDFRKRIYAKNKNSSFYKYVFVLITNWFLLHPEYPVDIKGLFLTYDIKYNKEMMKNLDDENGYIYGCHYNDILQNSPKVR